MKRTEVAVGFVILLGIAVVFFGTLWLKGTRLGEREMTIHARFLEIGQLLDGNEVKLRGVSIGRVERIALEPGGGGVIVTMRIAEEVPLPADPVVLLSPESMFGDWQAEIHPRSRFPQYTYAEAPDPQVLPGYSLPDISRLTAVADEADADLAGKSAGLQLFKNSQPLQGPIALGHQRFADAPRHSIPWRPLRDALGAHAGAASHGARNHGLPRLAT